MQNQPNNMMGKSLTKFSSSILIIFSLALNCMNSQQTKKGLVRILKN